MNMEISGEISDYNNYMEVTVAEKKLIDVYPASTAILNQAGDIQCVNRVWEEKRERAYGFFGPSYIDRNYFELLAAKAESGNDYALKIILGLRQVIDGEEVFNITYPVSDGNEKNWYKITIRRLCDECEKYIVFHEDVSQLIKTSHQLRELQERYKQQFQESSMAILIGKPGGELLDANKAATQILGYSYDELLMVRWDNMFVVSDEKFRGALQILKEKGEFLGELEMVNKSGESVYVEMTSKIYRNEAGHLRTLTMFKDISVRKVIAEKLDLEQRFTETALNSLPGLFTVLNESGKMVRWNVRYPEELGYEPDENHNMNVFDFIVPEDHEKLSEAMASVLKNGEGEVEARLKAKSGEKKFYKFRAGRFESKNEKYIVATGIDITEKLRIEEEKALSYQLMKQLFDNSPVGIVLSDKNHCVEQVNSTFSEMFGYRSEEIRGREIDGFLSPPELKDEAVTINKQIFKGIVTQIETSRVHKNGKLIPVILGTVPVKISGEVVAAYGIYIDISEREKLLLKISELFEMEKSAREEVEKSKIKLEEVFAQSPTSIALLEGDDFRFVLANHSYRKLVGEREVIGKKFFDILPELSEQDIGKIIESVYETGKPYIGQKEKVLINDRLGNVEEFYLNYTCKPLYNNQREIYGIFIEAVDVTELVNSRLKVQNSLKEKEILLQEVHHRVKNNLAVITGLMELQMMDGSDESLVPKLREVQSRIFSIARIHEAIYQQEDVTRVNFDSYLNSMVESWKQNCDNNKIEIFLDLETVELNLNQAVSCGLLTNEIMNLVEHSRNGTSSKIGIRLRQIEDIVEIEVENPNFDLSEDRDIELPEKFNLKIIQVLLNQLMASYNFENDNTNKLLIQFKKADVKGSSSSFI